MDAIQQRTLVTFQTRTAMKDSFGQKIESWTDLKTMFAKVIAEEADDTGHDRDVIQTSITITCRPIPTLTAGHRVVVDGKNYDIRNINNKSRTWLEIQALQIVE